MPNKYWWRDLKVGNLICDCRYKHLKIARIEKEICPVYPWIVRQIIYADWMPIGLMDFLSDCWCWFATKIHWERHMDSDLWLEDGANCSATHCCDPADHKWKHPPDDPNERIEKHDQ